MHFLAGMLAGALFSVLFIKEGRRSIPLIAPESSPTFILGVALVGAALASLYGDQLWVGSNYRVIPPNAPKTSAISRWASSTAGCIGVAFIFVALGRTFGLLA